MHRIVNAVRGNIVAWLALFVALGVVVPAIASANCTPTKPPHCWEEGIEPTSGACGRYLEKEKKKKRAAFSMNANLPKYTKNPNGNAARQTKNTNAKSKKYTKKK